MIKIRNRNESNWNKKAQLTIFIIIALILVVVVAMIFILASPPKVQISSDRSPHSTIESCTKKAIEEAINKTELYGGDVSPGFSVMYNNINRSYLCYTSEYYKHCVNQRPKLIEHIENEITNYVKPKVTECFDSLKTELDSRYTVDMGEMQIKTKLAPKEVLVEINRKFKMSNGEDNKEFDNFNVVLVHPIYDLAKVSAEITNQEAQYCNFDSLGFMTIYPWYDITKFKTGEGDKIYTVNDRRSGEEFTFAIRSCALPPGF
jgi:hypothetical protein